MQLQNMVNNIPSNYSWALGLVPTKPSSELLMTMSLNESVELKTSTVSSPDQSCTSLSAKTGVLEASDCAATNYAPACQFGKFSKDLFFIFDNDSRPKMR